ncbi:MAG: hypothetical protein JNL11_04735 [Bdellovibrionaceae bacterium]|nr:hypothetical protein [Pseudobdellovibrionaceae bacterium]
MKKILNSFVITTLFLSGVPCWGQSKPSQKLSSVELQWEDSPGAFMYEVEIYNSKSKLLKSFVSKSSLFKFKSTSGKIKIRGRVLDAYGKKGLWSSLIETEVPPDDLKFPDAQENPPPIQASTHSKTLKGKVNLNWPEGVQARRYFVKIYDANNSVIKEKETRNLAENFELDPGTYRYSVTPIGNDKVLGKETFAPQRVQIGAAQLPLAKFEVIQTQNRLQIKMPRKSDVEIFGELEYAYHLSETWTPVFKYDPFTEPFWTPEGSLKPGRYRVGFWLHKAGWEDSVKFNHEFVIKPTEKEIIDTETITVEK